MTVPTPRIFRLYALLALTVCAALQADGAVRRYVMHSRDFDALHVKGPLEVECRVNADSTGFIVFTAGDAARASLSIAHAAGELHIDRTRPAPGADAGRNLTMSRVVVYVYGSLSTVSATGDAGVTLPPLRSQRDVVLVENGHGSITASDLTAPAVSLSLSGRGAISAGGTVSAPTVNCSITGSGRIALGDADTRRLTATVRGAGSLTAGGSAETADVVVKGSGTVALARLHCKRLKAAIYGDGRVECPPATSVTPLGNTDHIVTAQP